jgi:hypothetical protein
MDVANCHSLIARDDEHAGTSQQTLLNIATMQYHVGIRRCLKVTRGYTMVFGYRKALFSSQNFLHATVLRTFDY